LTVLGIDVATNTTGYAVVNEKKELLKYGIIDTSKQKDYFDKAEIFTLQLEQLVGEFCFDRIGIEEILSRFNAGHSSAKVVIALARFNALVSYKCYQLKGERPLHINVLTARKLVLGKIPRSIKQKEYVLKFIQELYPNIELPRMKRKDVLSKDAYDIADAIVIALATLIYDESK